MRKRIIVATALQDLSWGARRYLGKMLGVGLVVFTGVIIKGRM